MPKADRKTLRQTRPITAAAKDISITSTCIATDDCSSRYSKTPRKSAKHTEAPIIDGKQGSVL